jgi:hypothetical protein
MSKKNMRNLGVVSTKVTIDEPASFDAIEGLGELITSSPFTYKSFEGITLDSLRRVKPNKQIISGGVSLEGISRTEWLLDGTYSVVAKRTFRGMRIHITIAQSHTRRGAVIASGRGSVAAGGNITGTVITNKF